ncbi:MAG: hypothetical protein ACPG7F_00310 [Aggregatilineales bacterium]
MSAITQNEKNWSEKIEERLDLFKSFRFPALDVWMLNNWTVTLYNVIPVIALVYGVLLFFDIDPSIASTIEFATRGAVPAQMAAAIFMVIGTYRIGAVYVHIPNWVHVLTYAPWMLLAFMGFWSALMNTVPASVVATYAGFALFEYIVRIPHNAGLSIEEVVDASQ